MTPGWTLSGRLRRAAAESPGGVAVEAAGRAWSWAELDRAADAVVARVVAAGTGPASVVAVETSDVPWALGAIAGVLRAGAVVGLVPVGLSSGDRGRALDVLRPALLLGPDGTPARAPSTVGPDAAVEPDGEAPAVVVLTSGTTGSPKGVVLSHQAMAASADAWLAVLPPATGWLLAVGLAHVAGLGIAWRAIGQGRPIRAASPADAAGILAALSDDGAMSHVSLVPTQLDRLLDLPGAAPPGHLRALLLGGGPIPPALVTRAVGAGWPVVPTYGLSEAGSGVTALATAEAAEAPGSAGRALPGVSVTIDAPDIDGVGEIVVTTPARCSGYLGDPPVDPAVPLRTGDLGRFDAAGRLVVVDRRADRIVRGGENVDPAEVEAVLRAHPAVADAAVVGLSDARLGHVPVAAIVLAAGAASPSNDDLGTWVRASLTGFKVPATVHELDALPRTPGGKLRREAIRALLAGEPTGELARPDGAAIAWRLTGAADHTDPSRSQPLVLLPGTLSNAAQLDRLAAEIAAPGGIAVHALDRRGTGDGRLAPGSTGRPLDVAVHVADLVAYLDARAIERAFVVGISFGGVLALELAARHPGRVAAAVAWEPPYGPLADVATQRAFADLAAAVPAAHARGGPAAAAETFLRAVAGGAAWDRLSPRAREALGRAGDGALTDSALLGLDPDGLLAITAPTTILVGDRSERFYAPIATALAATVPGASVRVLAGLGHPAPITHPAPVAAAIRDAVRATLGPP